MNSKRFEFALDNLKSSEWSRFEQLASQYLAGEFGELRTMASPEGDQGRDSELFSPNNEPTVFIQYSVTESWATKIRKTAKRIQENFPNASILIYTTNQQIGARADDVRTEIRKNAKISLDIRDRSWFIDRLPHSTERQRIAEEFATEIADPILGSSELVKSKAPALTRLEAKAALLQLGFQWEDDTRDRGLTKMAFDALVKSALRGSSSEQRMTRDAVESHVVTILPSHSPDRIRRLVNSSLDRLSGKAVKHWKKEDEFCLSHPEVLKHKEDLAAQAQKESELAREVLDACKFALEALGAEAEVHATVLATRVRRIVDKFLLQEGERFAAYATSGTAAPMGIENLTSVVAADYAESADETGLVGVAAEATRMAAADVITSSSPVVREYLRELADSYTLFAFLQETPDVQAVVAKMFSEGEVWLDTTVILPVLAETLLPEGERQVTNLLRAAITAGLQLRITDGVVEEVERHINRSIAYANRTPGTIWEGRVPFLYGTYAVSGEPLQAFQSWTEEFRGPNRPTEDVAQYLEDMLSVVVTNLSVEVDEAPESLRYAVQGIWYEAHSGRRDAGSATIDRLVRHDVENFLGVIQRRKRQTTSELGYRFWWLTFDRIAREVAKQVTNTLGLEAPKSPVMSPDFLANYIALGPARNRVPKQMEKTLPVALNNAMAQHIPPDFLEVAQRVRAESAGTSERLIRRKLRDAMDAARWRAGTLAEGGLAKAAVDIHKKLRNSAS
jgi:hypothetical protein